MFYSDFQILNNNVINKGGLMMFMHGDCVGILCLVGFYQYVKVYAGIDQASTNG